jgi:hypothetical protein
MKTDGEDRLDVDGQGMAVSFFVLFAGGKQDTQIS